MTDLLDDLRTLVLESDRPGWKRVEITHLELEAMLLGVKARGRKPKVQIDDYAQVFAGTSHLTIPKLKRRFITYNEYPVTSSEMARAYLRWCYEQSPAWGTAPAWNGNPRHPWLAKRAPLFVDPVNHERLAYVDVSHAYWQLMRPYRADTRLSLKTRHFSLGDVPFLRSDEVSLERDLRLMVAGTMFARRLGWYRHGQWVEFDHASQFCNPTLQMLVFDTLNAVAKDVIKHFKVHAWLTDAAIVSDPGGGVGPEVVAFLEKRWGLSSRIVSAGMGAVWSTSTYVVGEKETLNITNGNADFTEHPIRKLARVNVQDLRKRRRHA